jgi:hypothetical protein
VRPIKHVVRQCVRGGSGQRSDCAVPGVLITVGLVRTATPAGG